MAQIDKYPEDLHPSVPPKPRSHVPGYCGYVPGTKSQNIFGKTYGNISYNTPIRDTLQRDFTTTNVQNSFQIKDSLDQASKSGFWNNEKNIHAFDRSSNSTFVKSSLMKEKFTPQVMSNLTYEQARKKKI